MAEPVIAFDSSEQRNNTIFAKSCGCTHLLKFAFGIVLLFTSVSIILGIIQFTLILNSFTSSDSDSTNLNNPAFDAAYAESYPADFNPDLEETWTIFPAFEDII